MNPLQEENFSIYPGDIFSGIITHAVNSDIFYLVKSEASVFLVDLQDYLEKTPPTKIFWYPAVNEKFIVNLENEFFRAKRVALTDDSINTKEFMQIVLVDSGDTVLIPIDSNLQAMDVFFMIPDEKFLEIPPIAKRCKWIEDEQTSDEKEKFLKDSVLNKILTFEAVRVRGDTLHVKVYPYEQSNSSENDQIEESNVLDKPVFTKDELEDLYDEPLKTENALIAVQGYATQDDEKLCQFYDPNTGGCFKGALCKLKHLPIAEDAYDCRDRVEVFVREDNYDNIELNKYYNIEITSFLAINRVLFRFSDPKYKEKYEEIQNKINKPSEVKSYKQISILPAVTELILVKINGEFYRAKVVEELSDNYVVWCLDVGCLKTATQKMLYEWVFRLQDFKYLTHEMEISNYLSIKGNQKKSMLRLMDLKDQTGNLYAVFKIIGTNFTGRLFDGHKNDIGEIFIKEGLALKNPDDFSEGDYKGLLPL